MGPNSLVSSQALLSIPRSGGLSDRICACAADLLALYTVMSGLEVGSAGLTRGGTEEEQAACYGRVHDYYASLPPARFPTLTSLGDALTSGDADERFAFGVDVLLGGSEAMALREARGEAPS